MNVYGDQRLDGKGVFAAQVYAANTIPALEGSGSRQANYGGIAAVGAISLISGVGALQTSFSGSGAVLKAGDLQGRGSVQAHYSGAGGPVKVGIHAAPSDCTFSFQPNLELGQVGWD